MTASTTKSHASLSGAPLNSNLPEEFARFCSLYHQRLDALTLIKQLIHMIKAVQRHRGMSMGMLGGNQSFKEELANLQIRQGRRLQLLRAFAARAGNLLSERDQENLASAWATISHDWQQDSVIDNYELHCHLIEQLLSMVATLGKHLEQPTSSLVAEMSEARAVQADRAPFPNRYKHLEVLHFATRLMPAVAEQLGRIRALATYAAAMGQLDKDYATKLRYVIQCTRVNNEKLRHQSKRLEGLLDDELSLLGQLKSYEIKLEFLLGMIESEVLAVNSISADRSRFFKLATDIIDVYLQVVEDGVDLLATWHEQDIDHWVEDWS